MKFISYNGATIALILAPPNRNTQPKLTLDLPADVTAALSNRKTRRNFARTIRHAPEYTPHFDTAALSTEFRLGLNRLKDETVAVPLWDDAVQIAANASAGATTLQKTSLNPVRFGAAWIIVSADDYETFEIVTVSDVGSSTITTSPITLNWNAGALMFPLLFGRFSDRPTLEALTPSKTQGQLKLKENSPFSQRVTVAAGSLPTVGGTVPEFSTLPLWTMEPDWVQPIESTTANILYALLGPGAREEQSYVVPSQANPRALAMQFTCPGRDAIAYVERFFTDRRATTRPFLLPTFRNDLKITQDLPISGSPNLITIEPSEYADADRPPLPGDPYLALVDPVDPLTGLSVVDPVRITDVALGDLTTDQPVPLSHKAANTRLSHLLLVAFAEAKLVWEYITPSLATTRIKFIELPDEYGTFQADFAEPLLCYRFTLKTPTPLVSRFTNYEQAVTIGEETFAPGPYDHANRKISLRPGETKCDLISWGGNSAGNPLAKFLPFDLEADLQVDILEGDAGNLATPLQMLFSGDVMNLNKHGADWKSECVWGGKMWKRKVPHFLMQKTDNLIQFSRPTHLDAGPFRYGATILSLSADKKTIVCGPLTGSPDPTATADNFFGNGGFMNIGSGAEYKGRAIDHSSCSGGQITLVLDRPLDFEVGGIFNLWPGYDGSIEQCIARYNNQANHGGHPYVTDTGPQIRAVETKQPSGGKKG